MQKQGVFFALLATIGWSFTYIFSRGLADVIPPCTLSAGRCLVAFLITLPFALPSLPREIGHFKKRLRHYMLLSFTGITFANTAIYLAAQTTPALNLSLISCTTPIFTIIIARLVFNEAVHARRAAGIIITLAGILLLLSRGDPGVITNLSFHVHDLFTLASAFSFALYTLLVRKKPAGCSSSSFLAVIFGLSLIQLIPASALELMSGEELVFTPELITGLIYMGLVASPLCYLWWGKAVAAIGPSKTTIIYYSLPLFCGIEAVLFLGETVNWVHFASGALILGGLALATKE
ncbi:MAG: DMT family transporter [Desulfovibrio sp.]|nr:DMT family transporter [Desulfovibrio sp.]